MSSDTDEDTQLAFLLADLIKASADLLLRGDQQLTLNTDWLGYLAKKFPDFDRADSFAPAVFNFTQAEHEPLAFLFEIFQIVPKLTLVPGKKYELMTGEQYDLSIFRGLTSLRLVRVEVSRILGIQRLRAQLKTVQCRRAMTSLACLFCECAADRTEVEMPWSALEVIDCTSNSIRELDRSLGLFPHVLELNISDNGISELSPAIRNLRALTMLSLAQNEISSIRALLGAEQMPYLTKLTSLILSENKIDSLLGLERLTSLRHLDISRNKIKDFDEIRRIRHIVSLRKLGVDGNPISTQRHYRARVLAHMPDWMTVDLDGRMGATLEEHMVVEHYVEVAGAARAAGASSQKHIVLETPPRWKCDSRCAKCGAGFTWALGQTPRHHCRQCGSSVCHAHSKNSLLLPHFGDEYAGPERVCDTCYVSLLQAVKPVNRGAVARKESTTTELTKSTAPIEISTARIAATTDATPRNESFMSMSSPSDRTYRQRRPKSAEIADGDASIEVALDQSLTVAPRKRGKRKKGATPRNKSALNESILSEQDSLLEQVDQIFEAGGDGALGILQAWVDQGNAGTPLLDVESTEDGTILAESMVAVVEEKQAKDDATIPETIVEEGSEATRTNPQLAGKANVVGQPQEASTPNTTPVLSRKDSSATSPARAPEPPLNQLLPMSPPVTTTCIHGHPKDPSMNTSIDVSVLNFNETASSMESLMGEGDKPAESCDEFFVSLVDRSNKSVHRIIQVQGSSSILIIDFITGKTVDMVDLTCLVDIQQGSETPLLIRLSFIYGKNDRRVVKFVMEDVATLRELLDLLEPVATVNKTGRLNETVSALFKCLRCDAVFPYEDHRFEGPSVSCQECRSNEVVEFFVHSQDKYGAPDADVDDDSGAMNAGQGVSRMTSPDRAPETMPYSIIVAEDTFDCRTVDHNRKLVLNLSLFEDDSERFLGGIECILFSAETGVVSAFVVLSTKAVYSLTIGAHNALSLIRRMDFREFQHVSIAINSARLRLGLRGLHVDLVIGDDFKTWDFLQLLADAPGLSDCSVRVDATFSDAIGREVPDALVQGGTQLGCLQDLVSRATRAAEWRQRVALISQADGNPLVLCVIARSATDGDHPCVLVAQGTDLHVMQLYPANASMYVVGGGFAMSRVIDITEIEKLQYCESEPRRIRILRWSEGRSTPAGDPDSDYFTTESTRALRQFVEQLDSLWEPIFGFHLPLEKVKRLV